MFAAIYCLCLLQPLKEMAILGDKLLWQLKWVSARYSTVVTAEEGKPNDTLRGLLSAESGQKFP